MPTPKQIAANRLNAQKSTGPKTPRGKAITRQNAAKHGALAEIVVVSGDQIKESLPDFKKLCLDFHQSLKPVGPLEEMLVDQIVTTTWRLRRANRAETGEIALSVDTGAWERKNDDSLRLTLIQPENPYAPGLVCRLEKTSAGCRFLIHCLYEVRYAVEEDGELTATTLATFQQSLMHQAQDLGAQLEQYHQFLTANPQKLEPAALKKLHRDVVLEYLDLQIAYYRGLLDEVHQPREVAGECARQNAAVLPDTKALNKILHYEAILTRQLYRAMNQLERIQRRRLGENIPAPLEMEIASPSLRG
jgi:hypothetical protein